MLFRSTNRNNRQFSENDSTTDGSCDFLRALDTQTDMSVKVTDGDECLEARTLTGTGLLLNGHDLHNLILELGEEEVDDLVFFDGEREQVNFLHLLDLSIFYETAELGDWRP